MPNVRHVLVTGGSGFIGSSLCRALVNAGHTVRIFDDGSRGAMRRFGQMVDAFEHVKGDIRNPAQVADALKDVDCVFHLAYVNGTEFFYERPELVLDVGVRGMLNVLDGCAKHNVRELVLLSSSEVYQHPQQIPTDETVPLVVPDAFNPRYSYGGGKMISELLSIHMGRHQIDRLLIVRPHNVYGPDMGWEHVIPQMIMRLVRKMDGKADGKADAPGDGPIQFPIRGSGEQTRAFIHIDDFTRGLMTVFEKGKHRNIYHIGSMEEVKVRELALTIANQLGVEATIVPGAAVKGEPVRRCPDNRKTKSLGWAPTRTLREGLRDTVEWYVASRQLWPEPQHDPLS